MIDQAYFERLPQDALGKLCVRIYHASMAGADIKFTQAELKLAFLGAQYVDLVDMGQKYVHDACRAVLELIENVGRIYFNVLKGRCGTPCVSEATLSILAGLRPETRARVMTFCPESVGEMNRRLGLR